MTIRQRMLLLATAASFGIAALLVLFALTTFSVRVNGPLYAHIVEGKDLLTDVLPPPLSAIEPYLLVERIAASPSPAARAELVREFHALEKAFRERDEAWLQGLSNPALRGPLTRSSDTARAFFGLVDRELLPALDRGDERLAETSLERARALYDVHRAAVTALVDALRTSNARVESSGKVAVRREVLFALLIALTVLSALIAMVTVTGKGLLRQVTALLEESRKLTEAVDRGTLEVRASPEAVSEEFRPVVAGMNSTMDAVASAARARADAERALAEERERLRVAFTTSRDSISMSRLEDGTFVTVNEGFERLTGHPAEEAIGKSAIDLGLWQDPAQAASFRDDVRAGPISVEAKLRRRDGTDFVALMSSQVIAVSGEKLVLTFARDITDRKRAEELRERLLQSQKMEALGQLAGGVAHDFNNILAVIKACASLAREILPAESEARTDVEDILGAADRGAALARQLLGFCRKQVVAEEHADAARTLTEIGSLLPRMLGSKVHVKCLTADRLGFVPLAPVQLEQVILNLAINARDAMPNGGELTIEASPRYLEEKASDGRNPGPYVSIAVRDSGTGMSEEVRHNVFQAFFTTKPKGRGTGLGLFTCHDLVTRAGGAIALETVPGQGSTFTVWLPQLSTPTRPAPAQRAFVAQRAAVLAVDDDPEVLAVVSRIVSSAGHEVLEASTVTEALTIVEREAPQVVVTDVALTDGDGFQVVDAARRKRPHPAVVMTSGFAQDPARLGHYIAEGVAFVPKPFTPAALLAALEFAAGRPSSQRTSPTVSDR